MNVLRSTLVVSSPWNRSFCFFGVDSDWSVVAAKFFGKRISKTAGKSAKIYAVESKYSKLGGTLNKNRTATLSQPRKDLARLITTFLPRRRRSIRLCHFDKRFRTVVPKPFGFFKISL